MRMSHALLKTRKDVSAEAELPGHRLLLRAGLARQVASGIYSLTPLAVRAMRRIEAIVREEMDRIGGQEALVPLTAPAELWQETGRFESIGPDLARFTDRNGRQMVLAMTHEEGFTDLARSAIASYRQLPQLVYHIQTKFRDEPRPRGGLIRLREFVMKDAYSFSASEADLDVTYAQVLDAYRAIFARVGLPALIVRSDTGIMGGREAHDAMLLADGGENTLLVCPTGDYAADQEVAVATKGGAAADDVTDDDARPREVSTPGATTIADLHAAVGAAPHQTLKAVFFADAEGKPVLALIRGDLDVNPLKLGRAVGAEVRSLAKDEAAALGLVVGYVGPLGLHTTRPVRVVADDSVPGAGALVAGANRADYHLTGVRYGHDYTADVVADIALARAGDACIHCGTSLDERRGIEMASVFKLGTRYSVPMGATFADEAGEARPLVMGCYGIGITRLLACVVEHCRDADGIVWPESVAPYRMHLVAAGTDPAVTSVADTLYAALGPDAALYDDRDASLGVKLKDADLLGMPLRVTVSPRSLAAGGVELRVRATGETHIVAPEEVR